MIGSQSAQTTERPGQIGPGLVLRARLLLALAAVLLVVLMPSKTEADFHSVQISQLMAGAFGDDSIEFVEIIMGFRQNCQAGGRASGEGFGCLSPTPTDGAKLVFFDGSGNQTGEFLFTANTLIGEAGRAVRVGAAEVGEGVGAIVDGGTVAVIGADTVGWTSGSVVEEQAINVTSGTRNNAINLNIIYQGLLTG